MSSEGARRRPGRVTGAQRGLETGPWFEFQDRRVLNREWVFLSPGAAEDAKPCRMVTWEEGH